MLWDTHVEHSPGSIGSGELAVDRDVHMKIRGPVNVGVKPEEGGSYPAHKRPLGISLRCHV